MITMDTESSYDDFARVHCNTCSQSHERKVLLMKMLFSLKNKLTPKKSLKAYAWYLWY